MTMTRLTSSNWNIPNPCCCWKVNLHLAIKIVSIICLFIFIGKCALRITIEIAHDEMPWPFDILNRLLISSDVLVSLCSGMLLKLSRKSNQFDCAIIFIRIICGFWIFSAVFAIVVFILEILAVGDLFSRLKDLENENGKRLASLNLFTGIFYSVLSALLSYFIWIVLAYWVEKEKRQREVSPSFNWKQPRGSNASNTMRITPEIFIENDWDSKNIT